MSRAKSSLPNKSSKILTNLLKWDLVCADPRSEASRKIYGATGRWVPYRTRYAPKCPSRAKNLGGVGGAASSRAHYQISATRCERVSHYPCARGRPFSRIRSRATTWVARLYPAIILVDCPPPLLPSLLSSLPLLACHPLSLSLARIDREIALCK